MKDKAPTQPLPVFTGVHSMHRSSGGTDAHHGARNSIDFWELRILSSGVIIRRTKNWLQRRDCVCCCWRPQDN